jgi:LmbE family N-acetylglucosaminyl deacetylase
MQQRKTIPQVLESTEYKNCAIIVAHPDDETLWVGGTILMHPTWHWLVVCLCRKSDQDRAKRFRRAMTQFHAASVMGDLDDGPDQNPVSAEEVEQTILELLPTTSFDLIITHDPHGEYTRHIRHEETSRAVINLWESGKIATQDLLLFAYDDDQRMHYPLPIETADFLQPLSNKIWKEKHSIITETYGFDPKSWEAQTTPKSEAFWQFKNAIDAKNWIANEKKINELTIN